MNTNCEHCQSEFNLENVHPTIMMTCGHIICFDCENKASTSEEVNGYLNV